MSVILSKLFCSVFHFCSQHLVVLYLYLYFCRNYKTAESDREEGSEEDPSDGDNEISSKPPVSQKQVEANQRNIKKSGAYKKKLANKVNGFQDSQIIAGLASNDKCKYVNWYQVDDPKCRGKKLWSIGLSHADKILSHMEELQGVEWGKPQLPNTTVKTKSFHGLTREMQLRNILRNKLRFHIIKETTSPDGMTPSGKDWKILVYHPLVQKESDGSIDLEKIANVTQDKFDPKTVNPFAKPKVKKKGVQVQINKMVFHLGTFPLDEVEEVKAKARGVLKNNPKATKTELMDKLKEEGLMIKKLSFAEMGKRYREDGRMPEAEVTKKHVQVQINKMRFIFRGVPVEEFEEVKTKANKILHGELKNNPKATKMELISKLKEGGLMPGMPRKKKT